MKTPIAASDTRSFTTILSDALASAESLRDNLIAMIPSAPAEKDAWLAMMSSAEVQKELAALLFLTQKNASWIETTSAVIGETLSGLDVSEQVVEGILSVEMACTCGQCDACDARRALGDEKAKDQIRAVHAQRLTRQKSRIVGLNGKHYS